MSKRGRNLIKPELEALIGTQIILSDIEPLAPQVQPNSIDPTLSDYCYELRSGRSGMFRPHEGHTVRDILSSLHQRDRPELDISRGFELKKGHTYLLPLNETISLKPNQYIKNSSKSTSGRLFLNSRLVTDHNPGFDEIDPRYSLEPLQIYLLVQPLTFDVIIHPGIALNQLRFIEGYDAKLSERETHQVIKKTPLLYLPSGRQANSYVTPDGIKLHLDLSGVNPYGAAALKARSNATPIDLKSVGHYDPFDYFDPIRKSPVVVEPGEHILFASLERLKFPANLSGELRAYSHVGLNGPVHFAGFIDSGFDGYLVFEVRADEQEAIELEHGMPASVIELFRNSPVPTEHLYGAKKEDQATLDSHYQLQTGPRPAKQFRTPEH